MVNFPHHCEGKVAYRSDAEARRAYRRSVRRDKERASAKPYRCADCHHWHLGRRPPLTKGASK